MKNEKKEEEAAIELCSECVKKREREVLNEIESQ